MILKPILKQACLPARHLQDDIFRTCPEFISGMTVVTVGLCNMVAPPFTVPLASYFLLLTSYF
jgi:hypothetical protein